MCAVSACEYSSTERNTSQNVGISRFTYVMNCVCVFISLFDVQNKRLQAQSVDRIVIRNNQQGGDYREETP